MSTSARVMGRVQTMQPTGGLRLRRRSSWIWCYLRTGCASRVWRVDTSSGPVVPRHWSRSRYPAGTNRAHSSNPCPLFQQPPA
jgi:hypothetical protein